MSAVRAVLAFLLQLFFYVLIGRLIFDWIQVFARSWRPRGVILVIAEGIYTVTDPPLKAIRRVVKPVRFGGVQLDLAFLVLMLAVSFGLYLLR